jgi:hypothetical protein
MILVFDIGDMVGRFLPNIPYWSSASFLRARPVHIAVLVRLVFFPLFIVTVKHSLAWLDSDVWSVVLMAFFSFSNGVYATRLMMLASEQVAARDKEYTGVLMIFHLTLGLFVGVWSGVFISASI